MTEETSADNSTARKPAQVKNSTVLVILLVVIIPWVLLALPGYFIGTQEIKEDQVSSMSVHRAFGWPLTQKTESQTNVLGIWRGGQFRKEPLENDKLDKLKVQHVEKHEAAGGFSAFNLVPRAAEGQSMGSLWTDTRNWPTEVRKYVEDERIVRGNVETWRIPGLVGNIVLLVLAVLLVGYLLERRGK